MSNIKWFKHYIGMSVDDKFKKIRRRVGTKVYPMFMMWSRVLERATTDGGWFRESQDIPYNAESLDVVFEDMVDDFGIEIIDMFFTEAIKERLLTKDVMGFFYINNWEEYQHAALSTPRVQEHRENQQMESDVTDVMNEFNKITGKTYRAKTESYRSKIRGRFNDGYTKEDLFVVIRHKHADWHNDARNSKFVTPDTLFRPGNFDRYLNEVTPEKREAMGNGTLLKCENIYGRVVSITQEEFDSAEKGFFSIVK